MPESGATDLDLPTPEGVAGLVVAAMGAFVFTLYLRSWLREGSGAAEGQGHLLGGR